MKKIMFIGLMAVAATIIMDSPSAAQDDRIRNKAEKAADRKALRQDARTARNDALDLARLQKLRTEYAAARAAGDQQALRRVHQAVGGYLAGEKAESSREAAAATKEIRQSRREKRSDRREIKENRRDGAPAREKRDDRRDLRDDKRDAAAKIAQRERVRQIRSIWENLKEDYGPASLEKRARLLDELVEMAKKELARDAAETREDRRELREDRRESREDRRQKK